MAGSLNSKRGPLFLALFALPFLGFGLFMTGLIARTLMRASEMSHWPQESALLEEVQLAESHGDSTTYAVEARYRYTVNGEAHVGTRVGLHTGKDNIGSWQQDTYRELSRARDARQPVPCFVNPANPADAILFPEIRFNMMIFYGLFAVVFGGAGIGMLIAAQRVRQAKKNESEAPPDAPWMSQPEWASGVIKSGNKAQAVFLVVFALFWNLISWSALIFNGAHIFRQVGGAFFILFFPVIGLAVGAWAIREVRVFRRYGKAVFQMASVPGVLGGRLAGLVRLPGEAHPDEFFKINVLCERTYSSGKSSNTEILWKDERKLDPDAVPAGDQGPVLPVLFALPYDKPESGAWFNRGRITWRLCVKGKQPGVDVDLSFVIPVFQTPASRADFHLDEKSIAAYGKVARD